MSEMIKRYIIKKGPMMEYQVYDNAKGLKLIDTLGLCGDEQGKSIARQICEQTIRLLDETKRPTRELHLTGSIIGTGETTARDDEGNELILNHDKEIISINGEAPTSNERSYYHKVYGVNPAEPQGNKMVSVLKGLFK